jgi:hypothetical protein
VELWPWLLHRAEDIWDNPLEFRPERFDVPSSTHMYKYTPFGEGPRNCIGQKLALMESKVVLVMVLLRYRLEMAPGAEMKPIISITLRPKELKMLLHSRKKNMPEVENEISLGSLGQPVAAAASVASELRMVQKKEVRMECDKAKEDRSEEVGTSG